MYIKKKITKKLCVKFLNPNLNFQSNSSRDFGEEGKLHAASSLLQQPRTTIVALLRCWRLRFLNWQYRNYLGTDDFLFPFAIGVVRKKSHLDLSAFVQVQTQNLGRVLDVFHNLFLFKNSKSRGEGR